MNPNTAAPATKAELLERMQAERAAWDDLLATVPDQAATRPILANGWSVKDIMAHVAAYERWTSAQINGANEGRAPTTLEAYGVETLPPEAHEWDVTQTDEWIRDQHKNDSLQQVRSFADASFADLMRATAAVPEADYTRAGAQGWFAWVGAETLLGALPKQVFERYARFADDVRAAESPD